MELATQQVETQQILQARSGLSGSVNDAWPPTFLVIVAFKGLSISASLLESMSTGVLEGIDSK
jgi:hypothetical protein